MGIASSLASVIKPSGTSPITAGIAAWVNGSEQTNSLKTFQYFPEKVSDTKGVNYSSREVPGGSHPIYTFISGGERIISFDAIFADEDSESTSLVGQFLGTEEVNRVYDGKKRDVTKISQAIAFFRSFLIPHYEGVIAKAPPLVVLYLPGSGIISGDQIKDSLIGILTQADVTYESFHRDGTPRIVTIGIQIKEVVQTTAQWKFSNGDNLLKSGMEWKTRSAVGIKQKSSGLSVSSLRTGMKKIV